MNGTIRYFSMFTGVGGFELGLEKNTTFTCVGVSEIDKYANQLLSNKFPNIPNFGDCTKINPSELPDFDMLCGGFPCQSFSIAGKRRGFEDTRGTMFFEVARILEVKRPRLVFLENVKGLLNHNKGETFKVIIQTLEELGYDVQWMVLNSKFFGVPQNRERVFIIGSLRGTSRPEILPFRESSSDVIKRNSQKTQTSDACTSRYWKGGAGTHILRINSALKCGYSEATIGDGIRLEYPQSKTARGRVIKGYSNTLKKGTEGVIRNDGKISKLTPVEFERLQGFPDNWTESTSFINSVKLISNIWKDVKLKDAKDKLLSEKSNYVSNIIKDGESGEVQILPINEIESIQENAKLDVGGIVSVENGVCDTINLGKGMVILYNPSNTSKIEPLTKKSHISEVMEKNNISQYLKIILDENLSREKLSIILTWIKEIIKSQIYISVKTGKPIIKAIIVYKKLEQSYTNEGLLDLRMENISYFSDTQRYKMMGNAVTVNVIKAIGSKLTEEEINCVYNRGRNELTRTTN